MDFVVEETLKEFKKVNNTELTPKSIKKIHERFPVPREQKILWAENVKNNKIYGMVITDKGIFFKSNPHFQKKTNSKTKSKETIIYHYLKWEYFNPEDFKVKKVDADKYEVIFNEKVLFEIKEQENFFKCYADTYSKIVKESVTSAENIFADLEAIVPENYAKVNTNQGHGEMAEEALNLLDKLQGNDAKVVGRTNEKNGADRLVNGVEIQTKYYSSGRGCINACFDKATEQFRYFNKDGTPMLIEVPKDKYAEAVNEFRKKILEGKVAGVSNPNDASKYIKRGKITYNQARNLCKPGTIESLTYDTVTGAVNCSYALGITFLATFALSYLKDGNTKEAFGAALEAGIQVFGLSFFAHIFAQQVARTTLTHSLIPLSTYIVKSMGYSTAQTIVNAIRGMSGKSAISGATATKQLAKILRSNVVTSLITIAVFSVPDTYNILRKRLSGAQYTKNMLSLIGVLATSSGGTLATSVATAKAAAAMGTTISPGVGTAIGIAGGLVGGLAGGSAIKFVGDNIREDDSVIISRLFNAVIANLVYEYMLSESEMDVLVEKLNTIKPKEFKNLFANVIAVDNQEEVIEKFLRHYFEEIIRTRPKLPEPKPEDFVEFFKQFEEKE